MINSIVYTNTSDRRTQGEIIMAFIKTADLVTKNDNTYATTDEFKAEHGLLGTENTNYITDSSITLNEDGTGVRVVVTYVDEATAIAHKEAFADELAAAEYDVTIVSEETTEDESDEDESDETTEE